MPRYLAGPLLYLLGFFTGMGGWAIKLAAVVVVP